MTGIVIREYDFCYYLKISNFSTVTIKNYFNSLTHCFSNLGLRKFSIFWKFQNCFLHLIFRYLNSARIFLPTWFQLTTELAKTGKTKNFFPCKANNFLINMISVDDWHPTCKISQPWWRFKLGLELPNFNIFKFSNFNTTSKFIFFNSVKYFLSIDFDWTIFSKSYKSVHMLNIANSENYKWYKPVNYCILVIYPLLKP